uniref:Uncharacterized protein n=1 Tax=Romanomermis culicivorax TaxID=13658 RepID=A0A915JW54_ROMCU
MMAQGDLLQGGRSIKEAAEGQWNLQASHLRLKNHPLDDPIYQISFYNIGMETGYSDKDNVVSQLTDYVTDNLRTARKGITQSIVDNFMFKLKESPDPAVLQATSKKSVSSEGVPELASMHQMSLTFDSAAESSILNEEETSELIVVLTNNADLFIEATGEQ